MSAVAPPDWDQRSLGECARWMSGGTPQKSRAEYWGGSIPWISAKSLDTFYIYDSEDRVTELGAQNGTRLVGKDTILFIVRGMSLKTEFRMGIAQRPVTFNQDLKALVAAEGLVPRFLAYAIQAQTPTILGLVDEAGHGTGRLPTDLLRALQMPVPPPDEQLRIASVLGALDDKIALDRKMNRTLEEIAQAIFKSWFIDFDGVPPEELVDHGLGLAPSDWSLGTVADFADLLTESVHPGDSPDTRWEHYSIPAFDEGRRPSLDLGHSIKSGKYRVPLGAVLVSKLNPRFPRVWMPDLRDNDHAVCSTEFMPFTPHDGRRAYVYDFFCSPPTQTAICSKTSGSTGSRQRVKPNEIAAMPTAIPPSPVLDRYEEAVGPLHHKRLLNRAEIATLTELRDTLLPKLVAGELRVPEAEEAVEAAL